MQLKEALKEAAERLKGAGFSTSVLDAEVLLAYVINRERPFLYSHPDYVLTGEEKWRYEELLRRRLNHEPVAYLVGKKEFWSRPFLVDRRVLIPRPETEVLVEAALELARRFSVPGLKIIDVGTGSGAIGITMAAEIERVLVLATDISRDALAVATENARRLKVKEKMDFVLCSGLEGISGAFHLILSNPPYVPTGEIDHLPAGIRDFEPLIALDGGVTGTELHGELIREAKKRLVPGGWLVLEVGGETRGIEKIALEEDSYDEMKIINDYHGQARVLALRKSNRTDHG
ncbi:MAG: peptide chain release factor N(5)-glutamine methyltransferase [Syntrophales bacterium]|nr:peptide chain release factor N(5)-glutamine methyltransferase [Syntrophales bacterium]